MLVIVNEPLKQLSFVVMDGLPPSLQGSHCPLECWACPLLSLQRGDRLVDLAPDSAHTVTRPGVTSRFPSLTGSSSREPSHGVQEKPKSQEDLVPRTFME